MLAPQPLVDQQRPWGRGPVGAAQHRRQGDTVLDGLIGALSGVRQHRMGGISQQCQASARPGRKRFAIVETPAERGLHLGDDGLDKRIPPGELASQRGGVAGGRPGLLRPLVGRHEADVVDELTGTHGKDEKMLART